MMSETKRQELIAKYRIGAWAKGCIIEKEWRIRNPVFDKKGEKSTTMMRVGPVKTEDEVEFIVNQLEKAVAPTNTPAGSSKKEG